MSSNAAQETTPPLDISEDAAHDSSPLEPQGGTHTEADIGRARPTAKIFASRGIQEPRLSGTTEENISLLGADLDIEAIKTANRINTRKIPKNEKEKLIDEHARLVLRQFNQGVSKKEERRLVFVRWQLDRIEDAEHGEYLDFLEQVGTQQERLAKQINRLLGELP